MERGTGRGCRRHMHVRAVCDVSSRGCRRRVRVEAGAQSSGSREGGRRVCVCVRAV